MTMQKKIPATLIPGDGIGPEIVAAVAKILAAAGAPFAWERHEGGLAANTRAECRRIAQFAFDYAVKHRRRKVTIVHKANVLKALTGVFLDRTLREDLVRTRDLGGKATTKQFSDAVIRRL